MVTRSGIYIVPTDRWYIERAVWLTPGELRREGARHRSPMVLRCVEDALAGARHPLGLVGHL